MRAIAILAASLTALASHGATNDYWEGAKTTFRLLDDTLTGPKKIMETESSVVTLSSGLIRTAQRNPSSGVLAATVTERTAFPPVKGDGPDSAAQLASFAFCHIDKSTQRQTWLFTSGWFRNVSVAPRMWQRRLCGMTHDDARLWLLVWEGSDPAISTGGFRVLAFAASSGARVCDVPFAYDKTNRMMRGFLDKLKEPGGHGGTYDYLGSTALKAHGDAILVFGESRLADDLLKPDSNKASEDIDAGASNPQR